MKNSRLPLVILGIIVVNSVAAFVFSLNPHSEVGAKSIYAIILAIIGGCVFYPHLRDATQNKIKAIIGTISVMLMTVIIVIYSSGMCDTSQLTTAKAIEFTFLNSVGLAMCLAGIIVFCCYGNNSFAKNIFSWRIFPIGALITIIVVQILFYQVERNRPMVQNNTPHGISSVAYR